MATRKVLGLDLGVSSIGWALIEMDEDTPQQILAMGSRIVPLSSDDSDQFQKGQAITKNAERTQRRTARKGYDRYQQRRALLTEVLRRNNMLPQRMDEHIIDLWGVRARAAQEQITLQELGRVLYHINQKRGYKHAKADNSGDKKQTDYVKAVNDRYNDLHATGHTLGQFFYEQLRDTAVHNPDGSTYYTFRIKDKVYPRQAYIEEFDRIMATQRVFYPDVLTDDLIDTLRNRIIFYQRPLKSCKHLVSLCEFEKHAFTKPNGQIIYIGPKCAPRTSPLAQLCALWEKVNNIVLTNRSNDTLQPTNEQRAKMVEFLNTHEKMGQKDLQKILNITPKDGWKVRKDIEKGLKGNDTLAKIRKALNGKYQDLLQMDIRLEGSLVDTATGEVFQTVSKQVEQEPLYRLWHALYSIDDEQDLRRTLTAQFGIDDEEVLAALCQIDFVKAGYANKSHKFIRKLLPWLMQGYQYSQACEMVGVNHSNSLTTEQNEARVLLEKLPLLEKNALRQPIIEKILNQMINVVNALRGEYGDIDEVRVELARELKQSKDERESATKKNNENERENKDIAQKIQEMGITPTRLRLQKYKMWQEFDGHCAYCGKPITMAQFLNGVEAEVEHIIPQSVLFDDSFSNKVCACRACNQAKNNRTAREFMEQQGEAALTAYLNRVNEAAEKNNISKTKRNHLLWYTKDVPEDFIERQLRQSQYISKKAVEILHEGFRHVYTTSGSVTDFLRRLWGYNEVLELLNLDRYQKVEGMTEWNEQKHRDQIKGWTKRMDHRHHAIDAVTIAQTSQSIIQRLNTLTASREKMSFEVAKAAEERHYNEKLSLLEKWVVLQKHISVSDLQAKADGVLISFRAGKRVTTPGKRAEYHHGKRIVRQTGLLVPRGALSEETVYGKQGDRFVVKYPLAHQSMKVENIIDPTIRRIVQARLDAFGGNAKNAFAEPLYSDKAQTMQIRSVRCWTGLKEESMRAVHTDAQGKEVGFVKTGNNHHIAIYIDKDGKYQESLVSFWDAVERKRYGLPVVIEDPKALWDKLTAMNDTDLPPQEFLNDLPHDDWQFVISLQSNEMFILGMDDVEYTTAMENKDYRTLNKYLYRAYRLTNSDYYFRYHVETSVDDRYDGKFSSTKSMALNKLRHPTSLKAFFALLPHKVRVNILGEISEIH